MPSGGFRPGAGRKTVRERFEKPVQQAEKRIADRLPQIIDKIFDLAYGVLVEEQNFITGEMNVYRKPPDFKAASYLVDRILGKPTQAVDAEISGPDGGPIQHQHDYERLRKLPPDELLQLHREAIGVSGQDRNGHL